MTKYYILAPQYALRGWKLLPYAIQNLYYPHTEFFYPHEWELLTAADGHTEIDWENLSEADRSWYERWEKGGFILPCRKGAGLLPVQEYRFYSARFAEIAGIAEDIRNMPMGMNTIISEGEDGISGGQKQRLMIARAVAPKPKILIFDEATSALDNRTQKQVSDALEKLACTRIIIAHRLSTIRHADRILVLDNGTITEEGTYDQLIEAGGDFAKLVERQRLDL